MQLVFSLLLIALMIFALVDVITRDNWRIKYLGKIGWVIVIVLLPLIGSALWFLIGRERSDTSEPVSFGDPRRETRPTQSDRFERSGQFADDDAAIESEIAFHEKQAEIRRLEATLEAARKAKRDGRTEANGELPA